ncbi:hypothetical protein SAMN05444156_1789 [Verrucomicrobium sp. GAS474]|uniref:AbrB family transcriptional regulator n=1 Tax=Verrucomicrobium sp. GAS474 TaxID=1882831 RepID=UPI00087AC1EB|nr:AbrB family transcriptional regulator [Verrucomicrobium sp. GAS474]SDU07092.1 hypothetical protein SAMN05444156_1789 [Verrucomicrobium sp. GAS474]
MRLFLLIVLSVALALVFRALHLPGAWLFGPLAVSALFAVRGWQAVSLPLPLYLAAQAVIGTSLAGSFPPGVFPEWGRHAGLFAFAVLFILAASLLNGLLLSRLTRLPLIVSLLGTMPGGAGAMTAMSDSLGADTRLVTSIQYVRILLVLGTLAIAAPVLAHLPHPASGQPAVAALVRPVAPFSGIGLLVTIALAATGWLAAAKTPIPAAAFLVPISLSFALGPLGIAVKPSPWPWPILAAAYMAMGWRIGGRFHPSTIATLRRVLPAVCGTTALLLLASALLAWMIAWRMDVDLPSAYLAATPGGLDSVAAVAADLHGETAVVLAMQFARLLCVLAFGPWLARGGAHWMRTPPPMKPNPTPTP